MTGYVALLRGVNVGGVNIKMADLAACVKGLGYNGVRTVLASGNVVLKTSKAAATVKSELEAALRERFGYDAWVHVLDDAELARVIDDYPFERGRDGWHDYVVIAEHADTRAELEQSIQGLDPELERAELAHGVLYWTVQKGSTLDSVMGKAQAKARFKPWLTSRNMNTLDKLRR
ncbi:DUF1697 domain-containing protein [Schumannella sp. 10F1B-5-1]|uniref:DUF1697 domain-containing protein n=1 Tax=Schumannella sp. 10F1B-5-1 TaxID=2590780 RepID=UPI001131142B|nr:DUF1697 domain-containing protein [Schumannella sp. 10F1B-5-1]TPW70132.1 DUF1697 domain-containing protein [Schumannella sp. 10F1B-5-1]